MTFLTGKKTYIVGIAGLLFALTGFVLGKMDSQTAITLIFTSLGIMGLRNGITTEIQNAATMLPDETLPAAAPTTSTQ